MERFLGIDPGAKGGIAIYGPDSGSALAWRYPGDAQSAAALLRDIVWEHPIRLAAIEKVSAMPGQGVSSMFKFGGNYYGWQWALSALRVPFITVTPRQWQARLLDAGTGETKERSLNMARRLFPDIDLRHKADDGKADALHLARWAALQVGEVT